MTDALARVLQTEEGRNQARQLIHAQENDEVDSESISAGSEISCDSEENFDEIEFEGYFGGLTVHPPVVHNYKHCPPFPNCDSTTMQDAPCDCYSYGEHYVTCCLEWGENDPIDWNFWHRKADMEKNVERLPNNVMRKNLYQKLWRACDLGDTRGERIKLPNCGEAKARQIYPQLNKMESAWGSCLLSSDSCP